MTSVIKQGDTPTYSEELDDIPDLIDVDEVKIVVQERVDNNELGDLIVNDVATVVDEEDATVEYEFSQDQTAVVGEYYVEFRAFFADGTVMTHPERDYEDFEVNQPLEFELDVDPADPDPDLTIASLEADEAVIGTAEFGAASVTSAPEASDDVARKAEIDANATAISDVDDAQQTHESETSTHGAGEGEHLATTEREDQAVDYGSTVNREHGMEDHDGTVASSDDIDALQGDVDTLDSEKLDAAEKGAAQGVAELTDQGVVLASQVPDLSITQTNVVADESERLALDVEEGDVAIQEDESRTYIFGGGDPSVAENWSLILSPEPPVDSVHGRTGSVSAESGDYNLGQIGDVDISALLEGPDAEKPTAGIPGRHYWATDTNILYRDNGNSWTAKAGKGSDSNPVPGTTHLEGVSAGEVNTTQYASSASEIKSLIEGADNGDEIAIASGEYVVDNPITIDTAVRVHSSGGRGGGTTLQKTNDAPLIEIKTTGCRLEGLLLDSDMSDTTVGIHSDGNHTGPIFLEHIMVRNMGSHGFHLEHCNNSQLTNLEATGNGGDGMRTGGSDANAYSLINFNARANDGYGYYNDGSYGVYVTGYTHSSGEYGWRVSDNHGRYFIGGEGSSEEEVLIDDGADYNIVNVMRGSWEDKADFEHNTVVDQTSGGLTYSRGTRINFENHQGDRRRLTTVAAAEDLISIGDSDWDVGRITFPETDFYGNDVTGVSQLGFDGTGAIMETGYVDFGTVSAESTETASVSFEHSYSSPPAATVTLGTTNSLSSTDLLDIQVSSQNTDTSGFSALIRNDSTSDYAFDRCPYWVIDE